MWRVCVESLHEPLLPDYQSKSSEMRTKIRTVPLHGHNHHKQLLLARSHCTCTTDCRDCLCTDATGTCSKRPLVS